MPGEAPPDVYLRFSNESGEQLWDKQLVGESRDEQNPGHSDAEGNSGWFMVTSFSFPVAGAQPEESEKDAGAKGKGAPAPASAPRTLTGGGASTGKDVFKGFSVTMPLQYGCIYLMKHCMQRAQKHQEQQKFKPIEKVTIQIRRAGLSDSALAEGSGQDYFVQIILCDVSVESYTMDSSCVHETFSLNYRKAEVEYFATDPKTRQLSWKNDPGYIYREWSVDAATESQ